MTVRKNRGELLNEVQYRHDSILVTNVFISGLMLPGTFPGKIIRTWRNGSFELVLSEPMIAEIGRVLAFPACKDYLLNESSGPW